MKPKVGQLEDVQIVLDIPAQAELLSRSLLSQQLYRWHLLLQKLINCKSSVLYMPREHRQKQVKQGLQTVSYSLLE